MSSDSDYEEPRNQPDVAVNGLSCETLQFESIYNSKGYRILLRAGSKQLLDPHLHEANSCHAALVYTKFWLADKKDSYSELRIQSPHMKTALKQIVSEYQHLNVDIQHIILRNEPRCLFYHRKDLINYRISCMQQGKTQAAQHIQYMIDYMFNILMVEASNFRYLVESVTENPKLDFISLWMAFVPGELIYFCRKTGDQPLSGQLFRLKSIDRYPAPSLVEPNTPWLLNGHLIDYDGTHFGHTEFDVHLHHFEGVNILHELEAVPLKYHPHAEAIRAKFSERGKTFTTFHNYHFKGYNGIALTKSKSIFSSIVGLESHHVSVTGQTQRVSPSITWTRSTIVSLSMPKLSEKTYLR